MSNLAELYCKDIGVKIGKAVIDPHYYPIPFKEYITIHTSNKVPAKNYSYWPTVVKILKKTLTHIPIVQVGTSEDPKIEGVDHFFNDTTFNQLFFVIKHSACHVGIDSCPIHIAAVVGTPSVGVYGHTYASTCDASWVDSKVKHVSIEPKRKKGECPSFSLNEDPKTVDRILPEKIANSVIQQLKIQYSISEKTLLIGKKFLYKTIDILPKEFCELPKVNDAVVRIRMDLIHNEKEFVNLLTNNPNNLEVLLKKPVPTDILEVFKSKISKITYTTDDFDESFLEYLRSSNIQFELNCTDENKLGDQRNKFFHFDIVLESKPEINKKIKRELNKKNSKVKFDTSKIYMIGDQKGITAAKNYEDEDFWLDAEYFRFYIVE